MSEITRNGKYSDNMERECSCCNAKFTFNARDIKWVASGCGAVECPQCTAMMLCILEDEYYKSTKPDNLMRIL